MRVTEIAQIEIQDVLFPSGALRSEVSLRAAITKGCRQRCIFLTHLHTIAALERYLALRIERGLGTEHGPMPMTVKDRHRQAIETLAQEVQQPASEIAPCNEEILEWMTTKATMKDFLPVFVAKRVKERFRQRR